MFIQWLEYYKNIFDMENKSRPPDDIIEVDILLDEWLKEYTFKMEHERKNIGKKSRRRSGADGGDTITFS